MSVHINPDLYKSIQISIEVAFLLVDIKIWIDTDTVRKMAFKLDSSLLVNIFSLTTR